MRDVMSLVQQCVIGDTRGGDDSAGGSTGVRIRMGRSGEGGVPADSRRIMRSGERAGQEGSPPAFVSLRGWASFASPLGPLHMLRWEFCVLCLLLAFSSMPCWHS